MKQARLTEVFDDNGDMVKIVASDAATGEHIIDALWDPTDEQTKEKRMEFRKWTCTMLVRKGYESLN